MASKWDGKIPFDANGRLLPYIDMYHCKNNLVTWKDNFKFGAALHVSHASRGMYAVNIIMKDDADIPYPLSLADFMKVVPKMTLGRIVAQWTYAKRGQNFFCTPVEGTY